MILYHFTASHLYESIKKNGITMGMVPTVAYSKIRWSKKYRWLTANSNFNQSWERNHLIKYSRTDIRITINLIEEENLIWWLKYCKPKYGHSFIKALNQNLHEAANWYLYRGNIPMEWVIDISVKSK